VKTALRCLFDPAVQLMNRLSYPRKFAVAGMLFAMPLVFVTSQYIAMLSERVEISRREQVGNRAVRLMVPLWRALCEHRRLATPARASHNDAEDAANRRFHEKLRGHLTAVANTDDECLEVLASSARWASFEAKIHSLLGLARQGDPGLFDRPLLTELIRDLTTVFKQIADVANLTADSHLDSQNLALVTTRLLPELVEAEDRSWEMAFTDLPASEPALRVDLDTAEALGGMGLLLERVRERLFLAAQQNANLVSRLQQPLSKCRASLSAAQRTMRERLRTPEGAPPLSEIENLNAAAVRDMFALLVECLDAFDVVVGQRSEMAQFRRMYLIFTALLPVILAVYLGIGFCLAVIRTVDRMREVTDRALANDWQGNDTVPVEAQDELGHMIGDFGRLTVRLREEWAAANAEAMRASEAEESLRVSEERFALALRGTNDGIWDWDLQTDRVFYSTRFKELLGYGDEEFGVWLSALADVLHPDDFDDTWTAVERHLRERVPYHIEHRLRTKNGEYRWYLERGQAVWDENGNAVRMAGSISDINERKRTEEENRQYLEQVEESRDRIAEQSVQLIRQSEELARAKDEAEAAARAKSEFLANMSHELRTPLTAILGYADLLYEEGDLSRVPLLNSLETINVIRSNGRHLQELIDDILDLSKIEAGRMTIEKLPVSPAKLTEDVLRLMQLRAGEKGLALRSEIHYPLPDKIATDALRVRQVLVNLVGNAVKFTELGGVTVTVGYDRAAGSLRFSVTDTGIGMEPDQVERLFAPFSQADTSMSRRFGGTGLGLSISRRLAHMLGGDIRVESQAGVGSTFTLVIVAELYPDTVLLTGASGDRVPDARSVRDSLQSPPPTAIEATNPMARLSGRILLAEDVPANQKLISFLLQKSGAEVEVVENGRLAVEKAMRARQEGKPFDLILMDIQMPEMDGYAATGALREFDYHGRIVALTAHATEDDRQRCLDSGFDGFAVKPIQKEQLIATCREHLGLTHLQPT